MALSLGWRQTVDGVRHALGIDKSLTRQAPRPHPTEHSKEDPFYSYSQSASGTQIIPVIYRCIDLLSGILARLPKTVARLEDPLLDQWSSVPDHPVTALMDEPSRFWDTWQFWRWMFVGFLTRGNSYAEIQKQGAYPVELYPAEVQSTLQMGLPRFMIKRVIGRMQFRPTQPSYFVGLHGLNFDGLTSPSPVYNYAAQALGLANSAHAYNASSLEKGASMRTAIEIDALLALRTRGQGEDLQRKVAASFSGAKNTGGVIVLPPGAKMVSTQGMLSNVDIALVELLKWTVVDVARIYGIPLVLLMHYHEGFQAAKAVEVEAAGLVRWAVKSPVEMIQRQLARKLLLPEERAQGYVIRMPLDTIEMGGFKEIAEALEKLVGGPVMTPDEGRRRVRLSEIEGGDKLYPPKGAAKPDSGGSEDED